MSAISVLRDRSTAVCSGHCVSFVSTVSLGHSSGPESDRQSFGSRLSSVRSVEETLSTTSTLKDWERSCSQFKEKGKLHNIVIVVLVVQY